MGCTLVLFVNYQLWFGFAAPSSDSESGELSIVNYFLPLQTNEDHTPHYHRPAPATHLHLCIVRSRQYEAL